MQLREISAVFILAAAGACARARPDAIPPAAAEQTEAVAASDPVATAPADGGGERSAGDDGSRATPLPPELEDAARKVAASVRAHEQRGWDRLADMVDLHGPRPSGSKALEQAIDWSLEQMKADGLDAVRREKVMVPHWERGKESLRLLAPVKRDLVILGLGMSVGTRGPLRAEVAVVDHVDDIAKAGSALRGKIVLIDQAMPPYDHEERTSGYGETVQARGRGAAEAAKVGAVAVLVRSVTATSLRTPHTGAMHYEDGVRKIPAAAVSTEDAELLHRMVTRGRTEVELRMGARMRPDAVSGNAIGEIRGRERPDEIVLIGGHIDSWDVGDGATDDGSGCVMAMEAARILREAGLVPRRTIRVVLFTNEENGLRGATAYFEAHGKEPHIAAIEADAGAGAPWGFSIASEDQARMAGFAGWSPLFADLGADHLESGHGGADISPLMQAGVLGIALRPDGSHYFDVHHSPADTVDKIVPANLENDAGAMALLAWLLAEEGLPGGE